MDETVLEADGWVRLPTAHFSAAIGSTWMKGDVGARTVGLLAGEVTRNDHMGTVHGGALMTFADIALGVVTVDAIGAPSCATAQLQYHFAAAAPTGSFITCEPELVRKTSQMVFARGLVKADGKVVGSADAIFKVLDAAKLKRISAK